MMKNLHTKLAILLSFFAFLFGGMRAVAGTTPITPVAPAVDSRLFFEENKNQWPAQVKYKVDIPGGNLFLEKNTLTYQLVENVDFHGFTRSNPKDPITVHSH